MKNFFSTSTIVICLILIPLSTPVLGGMKSVKVSDAVEKELHYLLSFVGSDMPGAQRFDVKRIENVLAFLSATKDEKVMYHGGRYKGCPSAYHEFEIDRDLMHVMRMTYSPDIPAIVTSPSSLRMSHWIEFEGEQGRSPNLPESFKNLKSTLILSGVEHLVNSPDTFSGAYYEYDLIRTLILLKIKGRNMLISLTKQKDVSDVGKMGFVLGPDENWDYIYSGEPGVSRTGLNWVRSYMYDSYSIAFYEETEPGQAPVRFSVFKWIKAGYKRINFVKGSNIYKGIHRFADEFKAVLESEDLPDQTVLAESFREIEALPYEQLRGIVKAHLVALEQRCLSENLISKRKAEQIFTNQQYLKILTREEMEAIVKLEYVKQMMGKNQNKNLTYLPAASNLIEQ